MVTVPSENQNTEVVSILVTIFNLTFSKLRLHACLYTCSYQLLHKMLICKFEDAMIFLYSGNFGEVFNFGDLAKIVKLKKLTN